MKERGVRQNIVVSFNRFSSLTSSLIYLVDEARSYRQRCERTIKECFLCYNRTMFIESSILLRRSNRVASGHVQTSRAFVGTLSLAVAGRDFNVFLITADVVKQFYYVVNRSLLSH